MSCLASILCCWRPYYAVGVNIVLLCCWRPYCLVRVHNCAVGVHNCAVGVHVVLLVSILCCTVLYLYCSSFSDILCHRCVARHFTPGHNSQSHFISGHNTSGHFISGHTTSSLGRYVFGSEISYNKAPPRLPGLGC
jgi:hypothetical protein